MRKNIRKSYNFRLMENYDNNIHTKKTCPLSLYLYKSIYFIHLQGSCIAKINLKKCKGHVLSPWYVVKIQTILHLFWAAYNTTWGQWHSVVAGLVNAIKQKVHIYNSIVPSFKVNRASLHCLSQLRYCSPPMHIGSHRMTTIIER